jgi:hypothetical protein
VKNAVNQNGISNTHIRLRPWYIMRTSAGSSSIKTKQNCPGIVPKLHRHMCAVRKDGNRSMADATLASEVLGYTLASNLGTKPPNAWGQKKHCLVTQAANLAKNKPKETNGVEKIKTK